MLLISFGCCFGLYGKPVIGKSSTLPVAVHKSVPGSLADLRTIERHVESLIRRVSPAVVAVRVDGSSGSGVVISSDGFVLSAAHVCGTPDRKVVFTFPNGRTAQGRTLGTNHEMDAGLMKITDPGPWPYVDVAPPDGAVLGDWVVALGHPGGFERERSIVARLGKLIRSSSMVQTDCTLIGGDSGGPLFDMDGHVLAIHSRISESTTDNYHVPISTYLETWDRLAASENWGGQRPPSQVTIGVRAVDDPEGCRLESVTEEGPAFRAGLLPGDIVVRFNREPVSDADCLVHHVRQASPGDEVTLTIKRDGEELVIKVQPEPAVGVGIGHAAEHTL